MSAKMKMSTTLTYGDPQPQIDVVLRGLPYNTLLIHKVDPNPGIRKAQLLRCSIA